MTPQQARETDAGGLIPFVRPVPEHERVDTSVEATVRRNRAQMARLNAEIEAKKDAERQRMAEVERLASEEKRRKFILEMLKRSSARIRQRREQQA